MLSTGQSFWMAVVLRDDLPFLLVSLWIQEQSKALLAKYGERRRQIGFSKHEQVGPNMLIFETFPKYIIMELHICTLNLI